MNWLLLVQTAVFVVTISFIRSFLVFSNVTMQGPTGQAIPMEKGIAKLLELLIAAQANFTKDGYHTDMLDLGTLEGDAHELPFSISLTVGNYNT